MFDWFLTVSTEFRLFRLNFDCFDWIPTVSTDFRLNSPGFNVSSDFRLFRLIFDYFDWFSTDFVWISTGLDWNLSYYNQSKSAENQLKSAENQLKSAEIQSGKFSPISAQIQSKFSTYGFLWEWMFFPNAQGFQYLFKIFFLDMIVPQQCRLLNLFIC